jgi:fumarate reductase iron-sulfur subunit
LGYNFKIQRFKGDRTYEENFTIDKKFITLLEALIYIRENLDSSVGFDFNCKSGICGACAIRVDEKEKLACKFKLEDKKSYSLKPLKYYKVQRDLRVAKDKNYSILKESKAFLISYKNEILNSEDEKLNKIQSDCILCGSCFSSCPVLEVNQNFKGPFALTRVYRYIIDKREASNQSLEIIQKDGIWDCTLCGECTLVCPQGIDPKSDILNLRSKSLQAGFSDPNFMNMNFGFSF